MLRNYTSNEEILSSLNEPFYGAPGIPLANEEKNGEVEKKGEQKDETTKKKKRKNKEKN